MRERREKMKERGSEGETEGGWEREGASKRGRV